MIDIFGKQIHIRDWRKEDIEVYQYWNSDKFKWMDFDGPYYPQLSKIDLQKRIESLEKLIISDNFSGVRKRLIIADSETNKLIGIVSRYWISEATNWIGIGIVIYDEIYWSRGIGFEALILWIQYLFSNLHGIVRLDLRTWSGNLGMMTLSEKLGFKLEAKFRNARIVNGKLFDSLGFGILREEWEKKAEIITNSIKNAK